MGSSGGCSSQHCWTNEVHLLFKHIVDCWLSGSCAPNTFPPSFKPQYTRHMIYSASVSPVDVLSAQLRGLATANCYSSNQPTLLQQMYQLQFDHTHRITSHSPVVEVTRSTATPVSEQGGQFQRMLSHTARGGENADTDAPDATESRRRPIPTLQLETLKEAQSRQAARVSQELEGGGQRAAPPAIDIRETAEFLEGGFGGRRGAQPSRYPQTMESQDEPRAPHPDDDTVVVDEPEEGPPHAVATSDALSHNISAVTYENNATPRDWNHPGSDRSEVAFPLVSAIDPTQLAHLHSRFTSGSDGDGDLSALEEFPTLSPMVDTPTLRAPSPQFPVSGGALRAGLVANTHIGGGPLGCCVSRNCAQCTTSRKRKTTTKSSRRYGY